MTIKRKFGSLAARFLRNGTTLTAAEHAVLCSLVDELPAELRSTVTSQLAAYNLVQREVDGNTLNFYRLKNGSLSYVDDLPQIKMRIDEGDLVRAKLKIKGETEPLHAALSAVHGRMFTLSFSRAPGAQSGHPVQVLEVEPSWRTSVILPLGTNDDRPLAPVRGRPETAGAPVAAPLDEIVAQPDSQVAPSNATKTGRRLYLTAIWLACASALLQIAFYAWLYGSILLKTTIPIPGLGQGVWFHYVSGVVTLVGGLHIPLFPLLSLNSGGLIAGAAVTILVVRRFLIWRRFGSASPPASYDRASAVLLGVCMASLAIALLALLAAPLLRANYQIAYVFKLFGALLLPGLLSLPAKYLLGATLLYVETASIRHEGWWPRPGAPMDTRHVEPAAYADDRSFRERTRRVVGSEQFRRIIISVGVLVIVIAPFWSVFPTGLVHRQLCKSRAGEQVYEKVSAKSYLFVGEGVSEDGLHLRQALQDVSERRVDFIEVLKDPGNHHQMTDFGFMFGSHDPKGNVFHIAIGPANASSCLNLIRYYKEPETLKPGECLRYSAIDKAVSRYRVEAVTDQQATWFTPSLLSNGARVIDSERNVVMGEDLNYTNTSGMAFFILGKKQMICLPRDGRKPAQLHRKVLLGLT